jgi:RNA polymerase sigma-70 factor, ECF subfamily
MDSARLAVDGEATPSTFEAFFTAEYERVGRAIYLLSGDHAEAEDIAQEAMARVYERWDRVRTLASSAGYVYRVAINLHRRRSRRRRPISLPSTGSAASDPVSVVQDRDRVLRAMQALTPDQREAMVLVAWLDYDAESAGRILGIDAASVRGRIHRARTVLRDRLGGDHG